MGGVASVSFSCRKTSLQSSSHTKILAFIRRFIMSLAFLTILGKNLDKDVILSASLWASLTFRGLLISKMVWHLSELACIPRWVSMKPKKFLPPTLKTHFSRFNLMLYLLSWKRTSLRPTKWVVRSSDLITMSSKRLLGLIQADPGTLCPSSVGMWLQCSSV